MLVESDAEVVITGYEPERNPYFNMMELNAEGWATIVKKSETPIVCRQDAPKVYSLSPAVYAIRREALFGCEHWSEARCRIYEIPREYAIDIDTPYDFELIECLMKKENDNA
jgi:N-acylneuraminate cytidylyltransferase/CMP-N,N'-diacetyllegionaminic acid synthase